MKVFSWVQNKLNGRPDIKNAHLNPNHAPRGDERREEFSDWPNGLLAIGTLWNKSFKEEPKGCDLQVTTTSSQDFTPEEIRRLQERVDALFSQESFSDDSFSSTGGGHTELLPDKFLQCSTENRYGKISCNNPDQGDTDRLINSIIEVQSSKQGAFLEKDGNVIRGRSLAFLLKKMLVWRSGLVPTPSFRDPLLYPESRMRKIFRAMLNKKVHPQSSRPSLSRKKCLQNRHISRTKNDDDDHDNLQGGSHGSRWVKTDTEYIVLEI